LSEVEFTAFCDGLSFDLGSYVEDALTTPEVDTSRRQIVHAPSTKTPIVGAVNSKENIIAPRLQASPSKSGIIAPK
jgi:hypothetical protein